MAVLPLATQQWCYNIAQQWCCCNATMVELQRCDGVIAAQRWWSWLRNNGGACCDVGGAAALRWCCCSTAMVELAAQQWWSLLRRWWSSLQRCCNSLLQFATQRRCGATITRNAATLRRCYSSQRCDVTTARNVVALQRDVTRCTCCGAVARRYVVYVMWRCSSRRRNATVMASGAELFCNNSGHYRHLNFIFIFQFFYFLAAIGERKKEKGRGIFETWSKISTLLVGMNVTRKLPLVPTQAPSSNNNTNTLRQQQHQQ